MPACTFIIVTQRVNRDGAGTPPFMKGTTASKANFSYDGISHGKE